MSRLIAGYNQKKLRYAYLIDKLLTLMLKPFCRKTVNCSIPNLQKVLVIQSHLIGDLVMTTPMLRALKKTYPDSQIFLLANEFAVDLLKTLSYVDEIITMKFPWSMYDHSLRNLIKVLSVIRKLRKEKFDLAIDAKIDMRNIFLMFLIGAKRRLGYDITGGGIFLTDAPEFPDDKNNLLDARLSLLEYLGIDCSNKNTELPIRHKTNEWVESYLARNNLDENRLVAIHPGASVQEKFWQPEGFAKTINFLDSKGYQPLIIEGPNDQNIVDFIISRCDTIPPRVKTGLRNVAALISRCRLIICLDSAAIHLAGAVGTPAIAIYGPQPPELTRPFNNNVYIFWDESFNCRPCEYSHCKNIGHSCMDAIAAEFVIQKIDELLIRKPSKYRLGD